MKNLQRHEHAGLLLFSFRAFALASGFFLHLHALDSKRTFRRDKFVSDLLLCLMCPSQVFIQ